MNILITGGAGGIGSTLALHLTQKGYVVVSVDNFNNGYMENLFENGKQICDSVALDIRETERLTELMEFNRTDVVIHLAAITSLPQCESDPTECLSVNVAGTASVLTAARLAGVKNIIVASTSAIYENNIFTPFKESEPVSPRLFYPLSKKLMEDVVDSYIENYNMNITTLRFFNVFGPRQDIHRASPPLINYIVREVKKGNDLVFYSNGEQQRDYVHVDDVVKIIETCIQNAYNVRFNVCTHTTTSVKDIIGYAEKAFNKKLNYTFKESKNYWSNYEILYKGEYPLEDGVVEREVNKYAVGSFDRAESCLGWQPNRNIEELMIDTMRKNYELYSG